MTPAEQVVFNRLLEAEQVMRFLNLSPYRTEITNAASLIAQAFTTGHKLLLAGNGGSAAECGHLAAEFTSRMCRERDALPAINLTCDGAYLTARQNDYGHADEFARLVSAYGKKGDVLVVMSTSGNSSNILRACEDARNLGMIVIGLFGKDGIHSMYTTCVDCSINIPSTSTQHIQEAHLAVCHLLVELVEREMFPCT